MTIMTCPLCLEYLGMSSIILEHTNVKDGHRQTTHHPHTVILTFIDRRLREHEREAHHPLSLIHI